MNPRSVETILDDLAPRQGFADDWSDVLERANVREAGASGPVWRRRKWLLLAAVVAAVLVPVAAFRADHGLHPVTEPVVVQTGTWDGKRWQLVVSRFAGNGIHDGYCDSVMPYGSPPATSSGGGGGCGGFIARPADAPDGPAGINFGSAESLGLPYWAAGPVVDTAAKVEIHFRNGDALRVPTYAVPESFGHVRFYVTPIPEVPESSGQFPVKVVGLDKDDAVVACAALDPGSARC
jgi:hypothetical protein